MRAVVIGSGHNGLLASYYLRKLGLEVILLEASHRVGGMTESYTVGRALVSRASYVLGLMPRQFIEEFDIPVIQNDPYQVIEYEGKLIPFHRDKERRLNVLGKYFPDFEEFERRVCLMKEIMSLFHFDVNPPSREKMLEVAERYGVPEIVRDTSRSFLSKYLPQEVHRYFIYPAMEESPAYMVAYFYSQWSHVRGGMGRVSEAIASKARSAGVLLFTGTKVEEIITSNGRVKGVRYQDKVVKADIVVSAISPVATFSMTPELADVKLDVGKSSWAKHNVIFKDMPRVPEALRPHLGGIIDLQSGEVVMPSAVDPTRGAHVLEFMGDPEEILQIFKGEVIFHEELTPSFAERYYHLPGGNLNHLPMRMPYLFDGRPVKGWGYRTPLKGLYITGAGTFPGGQVTGIPGFNVVTAVKEDLQRGGFFT